MGERKFLSCDLTVEERALLDIIVAAHNVTRRKLISKLITDESRRILSSIEDEDQFDKVVELIDIAEDERERQDKKIKTESAARLAYARKVRRENLPPKKVRTELQKAKRHEYYLKNKRKKAIENAYATTISREGNPSND